MAAGDEPTSSQLAPVAAEKLAWILSGFEDANGVSNDQYCDTPLYHPMAEGKYLQTLAHCFQRGWVSREYLEAAHARSVLRLSEAKANTTVGSAWGLGFSYKGMPADEPYLITTAVICKGLYDVERQIFGPSAASAMTVDGLDWICNFINAEAIDREGRAQIPGFSPNVELRVHNSAAYACNIIIEFAEANKNASATVAKSAKLARQILAMIMNVPRPGLGWPYAEGRAVVDLLHQAYIVNSLLCHIEPQTVEAEYIKVLSLMKTGQSYRDTFTICEFAEGVRTQEAAASAAVMFVADKALVFGASPARMWSLGEALVALSRLHRVASHPEYLRLTMNAVARQLLSQFEGEGFAEPNDLRQQLHAAHGLAEWLSHWKVRPRIGNG